MIPELMARAEPIVNNWLLANAEHIPVRWAKFLAYYYPDARVRKVCLKVYKVQMGSDSYASLGFKVITDPAATTPQVIIGARVSIGPNVLIICDSRPNNSPALSSLAYVRDHLVRNEPVFVGDDVWLGAGVIILPGVRVGRGAIVGAGAVVIRDVEPSHVVAGVPARTIRVIDSASTI